MIYNRWDLTDPGRECLQQHLGSLLHPHLDIGNHNENLNPTNLHPSHLPPTMSSEEPTTKRPAIVPGENVTDATMADAPVAKKPRLDSRDSGGVADIKPEWVCFLPLFGASLTQLN